MSLLYLGSEDVEQLLPMAECIALMERVLVDLARGIGVQPLRSVVRLDGVPGLLGLMPGQIAFRSGGAAGDAVAGDALAGVGAAGVGVAEAAAGQGEAAAEAPVESVAGIKVVTLFPGNRERGEPSHLGAVLLFETRLGRPIAYLDAAAVTAIRTAAVSAVATRALARGEAGDLALLGAGVQARAHLAALREVRELRRVRVWSRRPESASRFAAEESARHGLCVEAVDSAAAAVRGADLVCTLTAAREPVLAGEWLQPGAHVNAVGACTPMARELDSAAVAGARLYVDRRESALQESGDFLIPLREGAIADDHIRGELGELLLGRAAGRESAGDVTLFKSLGLAVEDLAAAYHVYRRAVAQGRGRQLEP
jgi:alanine dehydrogenase